jgi:purine-binding chemotaxis protein CheW
MEEVTNDTARSSIDLVAGKDEVVQLCGFRIGDDFYAVPVLDVQEVIKPQMLTIVPLAPGYIDGLINLRGQIVTAINMRRLFGIDENKQKTLEPNEQADDNVETAKNDESSSDDDYMNIIVRSGESLYSLVVDEVLDVIDVQMKSFEETPNTLDEKIKQYIVGVFKLDHRLLILLSLEKLLNMNN